MQRGVFCILDERRQIGAKRSGSSQWRPCPAQAYVTSRERGMAAASASWAFSGVLSPRAHGAKATVLHWVNPAEAGWYTWGMHERNSSSMSGRASHRAPEEVYWSNPLFRPAAPSFRTISNPGGGPSFQMTRILSAASPASRGPSDPSVFASPSRLRLRNSGMQSLQTWSRWPSPKNFSLARCLSHIQQKWPRRFFFFLLT